MSVAINKKKNRVTLKDLALASGLSVPTVSQILNNKGNNYCSPQRREEVLRLAREMDYQPNIGYKIMTGQATNIAAIIFSQERMVREEHITALVMLLARKLEQAGYAVYTVVMSWEAGTNLSKISELEARGCRNYVFIGTPVGHLQIIDFIYESGYSYIGLNYLDLDKMVKLNEAAANVKYVEYFKKNGIDNFKFIKRDKWSDELEWNAWIPEKDRELYKKNWVSVDPEIVLDKNLSEKRFQVGYQATQEQFNKNPGLQAVICSTDYHALGAAKFFSDKGFRPGEKMVCGIFNTDAAKFSGYSIISAEYDIWQIAEHMVNNLPVSGPVSIDVRPKFMQDFKEIMID